MQDHYIGDILAYRGGVMTPEYREKLVAELEVIERKLFLKRKQVLIWAAKADYARHSETISDETRIGVYEIYEIKMAVVRSLEKVRAFLIAELYTRVRSPRLDEELN